MLMTPSLSCASDLRGNSFQCSCENKWLMTWLKNTNATVSDVFCAGPSDMKGKRLNDLPISPGECISTGEEMSALSKTFMNGQRHMLKCHVRKTALLNSHIWLYKIWLYAGCSPKSFSLHKKGHFSSAALRMLTISHFLFLSASHRFRASSVHSHSVHVSRHFLLQRGHLRGDGRTKLQ